jgi:phytoene desaturase
MKKKIIVIGSGFGGLAAACRLAARGHNVEIFEKRDKLGGRGYVYEINGFKFDGGPTMLTAPFMFDDIFQAAGKNREDYFQIVPVKPFYRFYNHDGRTFDFNNDPEFMREQIGQVNPVDGKAYDQFIAAIQPPFEKSFLKLATRPFLHVTDLLRNAPVLLRLQSYNSVYRYGSQFFKDDFLRRVFTFYPLFIGANPYRTSSLYTLIHSLEQEWGVSYALGGTAAIVAALGKLFQETGGKINTNTEVAEILAEGRKVSGVRLADGSVHRADIVISNADVAYTYRSLIPARYRRVNTDRRYEKMRYSMSLFVIYFGTRRRYTDAGLAHHNIILNQHYQEFLAGIFDTNSLPDELMLNLYVPTITDPSMAPEGCESFCVMAPVPHLDTGIDWATAARPFRDRIMQFLEEKFLPDLRANIVAEHFIDPRHFQNTLNSPLGAAFSVEPTPAQSTWFRPHNRSEDFDNLYFVGAGTHPGPGLQGVLSSAIIAEDLIAATE